ncbi:MAG: adenylosuccinate lyase [Deinococcus sp.]|nr:adenylosuccinate lyase [Deinococcus sp.]
MIPRYQTPEMRQLWSDQQRFTLWLEVERLAVDAWAKLGQVPLEAAQRIRQAPIHLDPERIAAIEAAAKHDVIAFITHVQEQLGDEGRHLHYGLTASDLVDTALAVLMRQAMDLILADVQALRQALFDQAKRHRHTLCIGRTHGVHAEPTTFGLKLLGYVAECDRNLERLQQARTQIAHGKLAGPVGTYSSLPPSVEQFVCNALGLTPEPVSTQVVPRDRHAQYLLALALLGASLERLATELRHLQRTEVREVEEPFTAGQKGSSAMPHKRNPVGLENICGLARLLRATVSPALEDVVLWHERDMSHSSVERVVFPDATSLASYATRRLTGIVQGLVVYPERMGANLDLTGGLWASSAVLLALVDAGLDREGAYEVVQRCALAAWSGRGAFRSLLEREPAVAERLSPKRLQALFDPQRFFAHLDEIFQRFMKGE